MFIVPYFTEEGWRASEIPYLEGALLFATLMYVLETYLDIRQHKMLKVEEFPPKLRQAISNVDDQNHKKDEDESSKPLLNTVLEKFHQSRHYGLDKSSFSFIVSFYHQLEGSILLLLGYLPFVWTISGIILTYFDYDPSNEVYRAIVFMVLVTVRDMITNIPFELYSAFVIEEKHGFNKQTLKLFVMDKIKGILLYAIIGIPILCVIILTILRGGEYFYLYMWLFLFIFSIIMMSIYPVLIMPLFNKFTPLEDGELRSKIEDLAGSLKFPLTKLYVCDGSKRSSHSNAYFYGMFKSKRIVLYDTLLTQATNDEIVAILGHELGHWKLWHTIQGFIIAQLHTLANFYVFGRCMSDPELFASFGFETSAKPVIIGLLLFSQTVWAPIGKLLSFLVTYHTRRNEFQADAFAVGLGYGKELQSGLTKISIENLSNMNPDHLYSAYHYSHPPLVERLTAVDDLTKKKQ